ncbi:hypothetical protein QP938_13235 [Porticoccaceae bacterium LTM1]|nr:hypothetical protein QP938_13235 [Porticoccaceae bacterium LTM1]
MSSNQKWQMWLVLLIPVAAVAASYWLLPRSDDQRDQLIADMGTTNFGTWIQAEQGLADLPLAGLSAGPWQDNGKWKLVIADNGDCGEPCQQALFITRQLHTLLAKRADRIERLYLSPDQPIAEQQQRLKEQYPSVLTVHDGGSFSELLNNSNIPDQRDGFIYLADSKGKLVLYYPAGQNYKEIIKDLKVLL